MVMATTKFTEWRDYTLTWQGKRPRLPCDSYIYSEARNEFWKLYRDTVTHDLEKLAQEGWESADPDLTSGVQIDTYDPWGIGDMIAFVLLLLPWPAGAREYYELTGYHIQLKRVR